MTNGLLHIIEVRSGCIADVLALPVGERVCKTAGKGQPLIEQYGLQDLQQLDTPSNQWICRPIGVFVPAICGANQNVRKNALDILNFAQQLLSSKVTTVQGLGSNSDAKDYILVTRNRSIEGGYIGIVGLLCVGPGKLSVSKELQLSACLD
jgi:hypothetical protein